MPRAVSRPASRLGAALALAGVLIVGLILSGCGDHPDSDLSVGEGQHLKLGDLIYNVQISRPLNPTDPEDKAYLAGQPPPPNDKLYLGVFMQVENDGDTPQELPATMTVVDTAGGRFEPLPSQSLFALDFGLPVDRLQSPISQVVTGGEEFAEVTLDATNRRGQGFRCKVTVSRMTDDGVRPGVILMMEPVED